MTSTQWRSEKAANHKRFHADFLRMFSGRTRVWLHFDGPTHCVVGGHRVRRQTVAVWVREGWFKKLSTHVYGVNA